MMAKSPNTIKKQKTKKLARILARKLREDRQAKANRNILIKEEEEDA